VRFAYVALSTWKPVYPLGGARIRYRPIVPIRIIGPQVIPPIDGCIDSASDDTVFSERIAHLLGIDLTNAPQGASRPVGQARVPVHYAQVTLWLTDWFETCEWPAIVAFADVPMRWALFGHAGFLDFFDVDLRGARRDVLLTPNSAFPGRHMVHRPPPP